MPTRRALVLSLAALPVVTFAGADPWAPSELILVAPLALDVQNHQAPPIFMVGPRVLFHGAHIAGAEFAGQTNSREGADRLLQAAGRVSKNSRLVIYCGCCPMRMCPNIRPAYQALRNAGYRTVNVLDIPASLKEDWTDKGYPVERAGKIPAEG